MLANPPDLTTNSSVNPQNTAAVAEQNTVLILPPPALQAPTTSKGRKSQTLYFPLNQHG